MGYKAIHLDDCTTRKYNKFNIKDTHVNFEIMFIISFHSIVKLIKGIFKEYVTALLSTLLFHYKFPYSVQGFLLFFYISPLFLSTAEGETRLEKAGATLRRRDRGLLVPNESLGGGQGQGVTTTGATFQSGQCEL